MSVSLLFTTCFAVKTLLALSLPFNPSLLDSGIQDGLCPVGRTSSGSTNTWKMASRKSYRCSTRWTPPPVNPSHFYVHLTQCTTPPWFSLPH